jgi:hypothetical protein
MIFTSSAVACEARVATSLEPRDTASGSARSCGQCTSKRLTRHVGCRAERCGRTQNSARQNQRVAMRRAAQHQHAVARGCVVLEAVIDRCNTRTERNSRGITGVNQRADFHVDRDRARTER